MSQRSRLVLALVATAIVLPAQLRAQPATDPDVLKGIQLVESGDYDPAILTLDNAARRLAGDPARVRELSQAYLYLGIAYIGKGHEAAARAKFREALASVKDLSLDPARFPPKVIDLFEAAREESARSATQPQAAPEPPKKGRSRKPLILIGLGGAAVAVAAVAVVVGAGGEASPPITVTPLLPKTSNFAGVLRPEEGSRRYTIPVSAAGTLEAVVRWTMPPARTAVLTMQLFDRAELDVATANRTSDTSAQLSATVSPQDYSLSLFYADDCPGCGTPFELTVRYP
jgi:hypothetical protein